LTGVANRDAEYGNHQIEIKNLAAKLLISSKDIPPEKNIPATDITINGKTVHFDGGNVQELNSFLNKNFSKDLTSKTIKKNKDSLVLLVESKEEGKKGILDIKDSAGVFKDIGLTGAPGPKPDAAADTPADNETDTPREDFKPVLFTLDKLSVVREGPTSITDDQKNLTLGKTSARRLELPLEIKPGNKIKSITFEVKHIDKTSQKPVDTTPRDLLGGPVDTINIKGIILNSYNVTREREVEEQEPQSTEFDFGVALPSGAIRSLKDNGTLINLPVSSIPLYIEFFTKNTEVVFSNVQLVFAADEESLKDKKKAETAKAEDEAEDKEIAEQKEKFPNLINPAKNAKLNLDGIDVDRDKNQGINDLIDGATIDLLKPTDGPVELTINPNLEKSREMVESFIKKYNDLLDFTRTVSSGVKKNAEGEMETLSEEERRETPLITSSLVRTLVHGLQTRASNSYPAILEPEIRILPMIGIGTGRPNSSWSDISSMHLKIENEELFNEMVSKHPTAVKEFFGQDKNGDKKFDDGMAFHISEFLNAYTTQLKQGIIQSQISSNQNRIKDISTNIKKKEEDIEDYEKKLRAKFGRMEAVIERSKSTGDSIRQKFRMDD
jgi:flagellar hook-associated protein 2